MTATPMSDLGVDVTTGQYGDESTDVVRRYIECGELRLAAPASTRSGAGRKEDQISKIRLTEVSTVWGDCHCRLVGVAGRCAVYSP